MLIGAVYPQTELGGDPSNVATFARAAEQLGYDHIIAFDHVLGAVQSDRNPPLGGPYDENDPFHDPFVMFGYLAACTNQIGLATGVLVLPQRPTALVARQAADVDLLSGGRMRLGVGVGWNRVEYEALGQEFTTRGVCQEEQIKLLRRLFSEPVVDFSGRFDRSIAQRSFRVRFGRFRSGWAGSAIRHCRVQPDSLTGFSSMEPASIRRSTLGSGSARWLQPWDAPSTILVATSCLVIRGRCNPQESFQSVIH